MFNKESIVARKQESAQANKIKKRFIQELKDTNGDKKKAAQVCGVNLVEIRSWRHKDAEFNAQYKSLVVGSEQSRDRSDRKQPFIELLKQGLSQRQACEDLHVSIVTLRTWKKIDDEFKQACLEARFGK